MVKGGLGGALLSAGEGAVGFCGGGGEILTPRLPGPIPPKKNPWQTQLPPHRPRPYGKRRWKGLKRGWETTPQHGVGGMSSGHVGELGTLRAWGWVGGWCSVWGGWGEGEGLEGLGRCAVRVLRNRENCRWWMMEVTWGADTAFGTTLTTVDNVTEEYLDTLDLATGLSAHIQLEIDNEGGTVTDAVIISVYATLDSTSEVFDDQAYMTFTILPSGHALARHPWVVSGVYTVRTGALSAGATDRSAGGGRVPLMARSGAELIGQPNRSYIQFALIRRDLRQTISSRAVSVDNLTCVFHRPMALRRCCSFATARTGRPAGGAFRFFISDGGCYVYENSESLRLCRRTALDHDGSRGANQLLRQWELRK